MTRKYWARRAHKQVGPFATYEEAVEAAASLFPKRRGMLDNAMVGYGEFGPHFDIRFIKRSQVGK